MPKLKLSSKERMNRELLAALRAGQIRMGHRDIDTAKLMPDCEWRAYYRRVKAPECFTMWDFYVLAKTYHFTDYQVSRIFSVEYHGRTVM